jgi:hypothetical protein
MPCNLSRLISAWQSSCSHAWSSYCQRRRHSRKTMPYAANPRPLHPAPVPCPLWWQPCTSHIGPRHLFFVSWDCWPGRQPNHCGQTPPQATLLSTTLQLEPHCSATLTNVVSEKARAAATHARKFFLYASSCS